MTTSDFRPGLEGVVAAQTRLSSVDGLRGELLVKGYTVEDLAPRACFEEVAYLLLHDELPTHSQLAGFRAELAAARALLPPAESLLRRAATASMSPMEALVMAVQTLAIDLPRDQEKQAVGLLAKLPTAVAAFWRLTQGLSVLPPNPKLGFAAGYLHMLFGELPSRGRERALDTYLNTVVDHGL